jgi:hypothetical protein
MRERYTVAGEQLDAPIFTFPAGTRVGLELLAVTLRFAGVVCRSNALRCTMAVVPGSVDRAAGRVGGDRRRRVGLHVDAELGRIGGAAVGRDGAVVEAVESGEAAVREVEERPGRAQPDESVRRRGGADDLGEEVLAAR